MKKKMIMTILMTSMLIGSFAGCGTKTEEPIENAPQTKEEVTVENVSEESAEEITVEEETIVEEQSTGEEEINEEARIPVDERYEYILYSEKEIHEQKGDEAIEPIIGINIPNGWENVGEGKVDQYYTNVVMRPDNSGGGTVEITTRVDEYESYFVTGEIYGCKQMEFEEKETVETLFGAAQVYYMKLAVDISDWDFQDAFLEERFQGMLADGTGFEEDGKRYTIEESEVALITIGNEHIVLKANLADKSGYQGILKEDMMQMFELD